MNDFLHSVSTFAGKSQCCDILNQLENLFLLPSYLYLPGFCKTSVFARSATPLPHNLFSCCYIAPWRMPRAPKPDAIGHRGQWPRGQQLEVSYLQHDDIPGMPKSQPPQTWL
jgi:hypothetical protein